jgi:large subunit GTPase 1
VNKAELDSIIKKNSHIIRVPRRPDWRKMKSAIDLKKAENAAFLNWRKQLATIENQDSFTLTPFERNIEMWRQLWRVVEVSDLLVQIVDARNPMLFYCEDLTIYSKEIKPNMKFLLLINKADLLVPEQKEFWKNYFDSRNIEFCFFSASSEILEDSGFKNHSKDITRSELLDMFEETFPEGGHVGFVGYPNVGKSSTINALVGEKRVSVAATPGKTKHFQTINLSKGIVLCDCPGLVFPNISSSRAELVLNGILPIDQLRDFVRPVSLLCQYVPKTVLESIYGISLIQKDVEEQTDHVDYSTLLSAYAGKYWFK